MPAGHRNDRCWVWTDNVVNGRKVGKERKEGAEGGSLSIQGGWWETALVREVSEARPALPEEALVKQSRYFRSGKW